MKGEFRLDLSAFPAYKRFVHQSLEDAALYASDKGARIGRNLLKSKLKGRLGGALGVTSDLQKKRGVYRMADGKFSASGVIFVRGGSERATGAIISATEGATIVGRKSRWLWRPTPELGIKRIGRKKVTPALYNQSSHARRTGPLVQIPGNNPGEALLIVKNVQTRIAGGGIPKKGSRSGIPRAGRQNKDFIVAFVGILQTQRTKYVDVEATLSTVGNTQLNQLIEEGLRRGPKK